MNTKQQAGIGLILLATLACGGGGGGGGNNGGANDSTVNERAHLVDGTIRIVAEGGLAKFGGDSASWSGSGFFIDPSGLAVTNNHVVTGAGKLEVYVGEDVNPIIAQTVAVSECSDLAVIRLTSGSDYRTFRWYDGPIERGLPLISAGYPLGDPQFTEKSGDLSKTEGPYGSITGAVTVVREAIEHSAKINGGNS